jgi:hypothetical protein
VVRYEQFFQYVFQENGCHNVGREVEVRVEEMMLMVQMQQNPAELLGDVEVLADLVDMEPGLPELLGQPVGNI